MPLTCLWGAERAKGARVELVRLGRSGLRVSRLAMGTMTFGEQADEVESVRMVRRALDAGITFFDTADSYVQGRSEEILGRALKGVRDRVVVSSKVFNPTGPAPTDRGLSRVHVMRAAEDSLRRLGTDRLDVYFLHQPDCDTPLEETMSAMDRLVRDGKVRVVGMSNYASWQMVRSLWISDAQGLAKVSVVQVMHSLLARAVETECLPACREFDVGVTVYNPLAGGLLTGKHDRARPPAEGTRFGMKQMYRDRYWHEGLFEAAEKLAGIAREAGITPVDLALRWVMSREGVHCVILGASSLAQLEENLGAADGRLPADVLAACDRVWARLKGPAPGYNR
jgi:aryl-alcohol dehydrogenase (NADP+)